MTSFIPVIVAGAPYGYGSYGAGPYGGSDRLPWLSVEVDVTNDPTNTTRVWTDITTHVRQLTYTRSGRNDELQRTAAGSLTALCDNRGDALTSLGVSKAQWVRVQAQWLGVTYPRWQGILESVPRGWPSEGHDATIELHAADVLKVFRLYDLAGEDATTSPTVFGAVRNDQRVAGIAALAGITTGTIDTDTDAADAIVTPYSEGTDAFSTLIEIEDSENGLLVAEPDGTLSFQGRHYRLLNSATSTSTFGESAGQIPYRDTVSYDDDDTRIANIVSVTTSGGTASVVTDTASQGEYFKRRLNRTLLSSDVNLAQSAAEFLLGRYKDPSPRIPAIDVQLYAASNKDPALVTALLAAGNSTRFTWKRGATSPISTDVYVEQITESVDPRAGWDMQLQLSPADDESGWVLGDSVNGVLGTTTRLVY